MDKRVPRSHRRKKKKCKHRDIKGSSNPDGLRSAIAAAKKSKMIKAAAEKRRVKRNAALQARRKQQQQQFANQVIEHHVSNATKNALGMSLEVKSAK